MKRADLAAISVLAAGVGLLLFRGTLGLWWTFDDPHILHKVVTEELSALFFSPQTYRTFSTVHFTPMVLLSYALDQALFGLAPLGFYIHQAGSLVLAAGGIYWIVRRWNRAAALWAGGLFLLSGPAALASHVLMLRHYVEGAFWAVLTVILFFSPEPSRKRMWAAGGTFFLACLCKEIYAPLALLLPFFGGRRRTLARAVPLLVTLAVYLAWRGVMIGGSSMVRAGALLLGQGAPWRLMMEGVRGMIAALFSGAGGAPWIVLGLISGVFVLILLRLVRERRYAPALGTVLSAGAALACLAPVWPELVKMEIMSYRLSFHIAILLAVGFGYLAARIVENARGRRPAQWLAALGMLGLVGFAGFSQQRMLEDFRAGFLRQQSEQYRFLYFQDERKTLVTRSLDSIYWHEIAALRARNGHGRPPVSCTMPFDFRNGIQTQYYRYDGPTGGFEEITAQFAAEKQKLLQSIRLDRPLSVSIGVNSGVLRITVGPSEEGGEVHFLIGSRPNIYEAPRIPPILSMRIPVLRRVPYYVRVARKHPDGSWALSPQWRLNFAQERSITWSNTDSLRSVSKEAV